MRAQSTMAVIVVAIVLMIFILILLMNSLLGPSQSEAFKREYSNLYVNNLLLSLLRSDTGMGTFSDVLKDAYFSEGGSLVFVDENLPEYMSGVFEATGHTEYRWLLEAGREGGAAKQWGDPSVKDSKLKIDARTLLMWGANQLEVKLYILAE